jgi:hypothetical protein
METAKQDYIEYGRESFKDVAIIQEIMSGINTAGEEFKFATGGATSQTLKSGLCQTVTLIN